MLLAGIVSISHPVVAQETISNVNKQKVVEAVNNHAGEFISLSNEIWEYAEIAFKESQSADALVEYAEANGFKVTRGVGEIPTAFVAEYGSGGPIIGIMGEFMPSPDFLRMPFLINLH